MTTLYSINYLLQCNDTITTAQTIGMALQFVIFVLQCVLHWVLSQQHHIMKKFSNNTISQPTGQIFRVKLSIPRQKLCQNIFLQVKNCVHFYYKHVQAYVACVCPNMSGHVWPHPDIFLSFAYITKFGKQFTHRLVHTHTSLTPRPTNSSRIPQAK